MPREEHVDLPNAEDVHKRAYLAYELVKKLTYTAVGLDFLAVILAFIDGTSPPTSTKWFLIFSFLLIVSATLLRQYTSEVKSFAERFRKASLHAVIESKDCATRTLSDAEIDTPLLSNVLTKKDPPKLLSYYAPLMKPGDDRRRELYSQNAFYSSCLSKSAFWLYLFYSILIFLVSAFFLYHSILAPQSNEEKTGTLQVIFSIILTFFWIRSLDLTISTHRSNNEFKKLSELLIADNAKEPHYLDELTRTYDLTTMNSSFIPTFLYEHNRDNIKKLWETRRKELRDES